MPTRRSTMPAAPVETQVRGPVASSDVEYAVTKAEHVIGYANQPVLAARVVLTMAQDPALDRPARAEVSLDVNGTQVRAHAVASDLLAAVDLMEEKLRNNLVQLQDRRRTRHRWIGEATEHEWRHGDLPTVRDAHFPRPPAEREIVRRKTFALTAMTPDEAAYEMGLLGHDFYLFTDSGTGKDAVVYVDGAGRFALRGDTAPGTDSEALVERLGGAPELSVTEAVSRLELGGEPFVFFLDPDSGRGRVLYIRYDGHYGLITAA